jgi:pimeloyl-ACP methyl ester carboxylesterase
MRLGLVFAVSLICVCLSGSPVRALPELEKPTYAYPYAAAPAAAFTQRHRAGTTTSQPPAPSDYYLFEPRTHGGALLAEAPLIVFLHGAAPFPNAPAPTDVRSQIQHYVRHGFTVAWLMFCDRDSICSDFQSQEQTALDSLEAVIDELGQPGHVHVPNDAQGRPRLVFLAHSVGTVMAARMAARLGADQQADPAVPAPAALILLDPAGYEQKFDLGDIHIDIRKIFPLEPPALDGMRPDTKIVALVAEGSVNHANSRSTGPRILHYAPVADKLGWVVPHQCVRTNNNGPGDYTTCNGREVEGRTADQSGTFFGWRWRDYYATHGSPADEARVSPVAYLGFFDHALACVREALGEGAQARCSGSLVTDMGRWRENGAVVQPARPKVPYSWTPPTN